MVSPCPSKKKNDEFAESDLSKKLVPGEKPLLNRKFYLDLKNRLVASKLETQIKELGGSIEVFLVKEVSHVITDRESWQLNKTNPSTPQQSTLSSNDSPRSARSVRPKTRADAMLERARSQTTGVVNDPLDDAKQWGIAIWTAEKVFAWLEQIKEQLVELKKKVKAVPLKQPYIKFEAFDRKTRPIFKEIPVWPTVNWSGRQGDPAFICKAAATTTTATTTVSRRKNMTRKTRVNHQQQREEDTLRPGYCEVCRVEYSHLEKHQQSEKHQKFIGDNANFIGLDTLINESANIETFLKLHSKEEKMCESDTEYNPPKRGRKPKNNSNSSMGDREKLKNLLSSPSETTGGHRLRSRTQVNYVISTPTDDDISPRELRSSSRLLSKAAEKLKQETEQNTWESGRPKRSCILNKKRISADERLVVDNKTYYKVEVMLNKLRSSGLTAKDHELLKQHRSPSPEKKSKETEDGLIVKFRRIRNAELTYLNNEAENFLFPKKEESSDEDPDADGPNTTVSSNRHESSSLLSSEAEEHDKTAEHSKEANHRKRASRVKAEDDSAMDGFSHEVCTPKRKGRLAKIKVEEEASIESSSYSEVSNSKRKDLIVIDDGSMDSTCSEAKKKRRRTHAEAFIMDNQKYYKFETPGSRLRYQGSFLPPVTSTSKVSPTKNNGDCTIKTETAKTAPPTQPRKINLDELQYSFEMVPEHEAWYEAFRRQDTGQVTYLPLNIDFSKPFFLPYQLPPLPPLNPKVCIAAYKQQQKLCGETASTSQQALEQSTASSEGESSAVLDEDSKASTSASEDVVLKMSEEESEQGTSKFKKRRSGVAATGRNPRKSPRQHASTLAILSSLVHHRRKRPRSSSALNESRQKLPAIKEEGQVAEDYEEIERGIERMFEEEDDKYLQDLETIPEHEGVDIRCVPDAIEALQTYDELKDQAPTKPTKRLLINGSSTGRKPGRKKKTNKTGWPNRNRRNALRNRETCSTKEEDEEDEGKACSAPVKSGVDWEDASKEMVAKINNCEFQPIVRVQKLDSEVIVRHKRSCSVDMSPPNTERRAKRTQSSPKSPRALRKPRGRWYKER